MERMTHKVQIVTLISAVAHTRMHNSECTDPQRTHCESPTALRFNETVGVVV